MSLIDILVGPVTSIFVALLPKLLEQLGDRNDKLSEIDQKLDRLQAELKSVKRKGK